MPNRQFKRKSSKAPRLTGDNNVDRVLRDVYDEINSLVDSVNTPYVSGEISSRDGKPGDIRVVKDLSYGLERKAAESAYFLEAKTEDGWVRQYMDRTEHSGVSRDGTIPVELLKEDTKRNIKQGSLSFWKSTAPLNSATPNVYIDEDIIVGKNSQKALYFKTSSSSYTPADKAGYTALYWDGDADKLFVKEAGQSAKDLTASATVDFASVKGALGAANSAVSFNGENITSAAWDGTAISEAKGGTGVTSTTTVGKALMGAADDAAGRTTLGLGTAATKNTGAGAGDVILGNDSRLTDARQCDNTFANNATAAATIAANIAADTITTAQLNVASDVVTLLDNANLADFKTDLALDAADISDFDTEVANNTAVAANTSKTSFPGFGTSGGTALEGDTTATDIGGITASSTHTLTNKTFDANGTGNSLSNVDMANDVTGTLPTGNGGTGLTSIDTLLNSNVDKPHVNALNITQVGVLASGSITTAFGNIDNGSSTITTTGLITGGTLKVSQQAYFNAAQTGSVDSTSGAASVDINWTAGNKYHLTVTHTSNTVNFSSNPDGPCNLVLKVIQGDGSDTIGTWAVTDSDGGAIKWVGKAAPTLSAASGDIDIVTFYFDGTNYHGACLKDFG
tara:strand:- start:170 stop:2047 length:1878 start_codon:yes stop_codon:yes gene_type:complete